MTTQNPFAEDEDRKYIWEMLVTRDIKAFLNVDWSMIKDDFITDGFVGIDGCQSNNPDSWKFRFPDVETYRIEWMRQAQSFKETEWAENTEEALFRITELRDIKINDNSALVHKKFNGEIKRSDGQNIPLCWRTLYYCRKINGIWKIVGFNGYLPHYSDLNNGSSHTGKRMPANATQHKTAGPYSPVLIIDPKSMTVISGQAAIYLDGDIKGDTIEEQTIYTLENCRQALDTAGYSMADVFKVNVYLKDIGDWSRFNEVYKRYFEKPSPVRTAIQAGLLPGLLVEIDLWAVKK